MSDDLDNDYVKIKRNLFDLTDQGTEAIELLKYSASLSNKMQRLVKRS